MMDYSKNKDAANENSAIQKTRVFRKFTYRGVDLDCLLDMNLKGLLELMPSKARRYLTNGLGRRMVAFLKKLRLAKKSTLPGEKPFMIKTHLRSAVILPEMIGAVIGVYNGKVFIPLEVKPEMIGRKLGEFSITYKCVRHGRPGIGATHSSRFIPLK